MEPNSKASKRQSRSQASAMCSDVCSCVLYRVICPDPRTTDRDMAIMIVIMMGASEQPPAHAAPKPVYWPDTACYLPF